jgi:hypothetical protein
LRKKSKQDTNVIINHLSAASAEAFKDLSANLHIQLHVGWSSIVDITCARMEMRKKGRETKVLASRQECKN